MIKIRESVLGIAMLAASASGCGNLEGEEGLELETRTGAIIVPSGSTPTYEQVNQCSPGGQQMLCCPPGKAVAGYQPASIVNNVYYKETLKCMPVTFDDAGPSLDVYTQREIWQNFGPPPSGGHTTMHACEFGKVMVGFHAGLNRLACRHVAPTGGNYQEVLDLSTTDPNTPPAGIMPPGKKMHTCSISRAMSGIHLGKNQLGCVTDQFPF